MQLRTLSLRPGQFQQLIPMMLQKLEVESTQLIKARKSRVEAANKAHEARLKRLKENYDAAIRSAKERHASKLAEIDARLEQTIVGLLNRRVNIDFFTGSLNAFLKQALGAANQANQDVPTILATKQPGTPPKPSHEATGEKAKAGH